MAMTKKEVADAVRAWRAAWHTGDIQTIIAMEAWGGGFGFRMLARRDHAAQGEEGRVQGLAQFFGQMDYYRMVLEDLQTSVTGDIGLAWGVFIEEFQEKGRPPERARVRFSKVLTKGASGWQVLLYHRDIQPFTDAGAYPRALTVVAPAHYGGGKAESACPGSAAALSLLECVGGYGLTWHETV
jgi:ketosteroid isomerase-like protein